MATFQCEEGLIPLGPTTSTCTDTEQTDTPGQWLPNPADTQCAGNSKSIFVFAKSLCMILQFTMYMPALANLQIGTHNKFSS